MMGSYSQMSESFICQKEGMSITFLFADSCFFQDGAISPLIFSQSPVRSDL